MKYKIDDRRIKRLDTNVEKGLLDRMFFVASEQIEREITYNLLRPIFRRNYKIGRQLL